MSMLQGGYSSHWEHREGMKDVGGGEEGASFGLSVGGERLFPSFLVSPKPSKKLKLAAKSLSKCY